MKGSEFVFHYVHLLLCKSDKINPNHGGSYIHSLDLIKNKKATINPINKKVRCNSRVKSWRNKKRSTKNNKN